MTRKTLELPLGLSASDIIGGGTSGLALLIPHTQMVIKISHDDPDERERCEREAIIYERLRESNIPGSSSLLLGYSGRSECGGWILLEYAQNKTIRRYLSIPDNQPASTILISRWAQQSAIALRFVHANNIAHGDVSCDNFFLDEHLNLRLGDFTSSSLGLETCLEQDDIFEFGLAVYEMSTGIQLFKGLYLCPDEKREKIKHDGLPDLTQLPVTGLAGTIAKCLQSHYNNVGEVFHDIENASQK
ncbi:kinase-like protein [Byssothecium circinans]|uniref:Kinase-like protein n=1 Tax=Byssothecium circinans TaxID=147558 RepID=A0A6A5T7I7_9PLEO|nr:kinase-like protein [Byssothecium circinans]